MPRTIPNLSALALALTSAGCAEPIAGDWDATFFDASGYDALDMPYSGVVTTDAGVYDYFLSLRASFNAAGTGSLSFYERFAQQGQTTFEETKVYAARAYRRGRRYNVDVPTYDELILQCRVAGDALTCSGDDAGGVQYDMDFMRREQ